MRISREPHPAARKEAVMETPSHVKTPFSQLLLRWAACRISRITASMKPKYLAGQIAVDIAATGNPTGV
jgi:hypothetical protein